MSRLLELETDKVTIEVPAPAAGTLSEIVAAAGETVGLGALLGQIAEGAAGAAAAPRRCRGTDGRRSGSRCRPAAGCCRRRPLPPAAPPCRQRRPPPRCSPKTTSRPIRSKARGKRGQVLKGDVIAAVAKGLSAPAASEPVKVAARVARRLPRTRRAKSA